ncbi:MAG: ATPase [Desulfobulbaceae bacterium]|nr:MAG: ATPase [Desulfobulbaceae bacterium]
MRYLKAKHGVGLLVALLILTTAVGAQAGEITSAKLWNLFYRALNFAALMFILIYFLKKPVGNFFGNRRATIRAELEDLEGKRVEVEQSYKENERKMVSLEISVQEIVAEAVRQGEIERERILAEAEQSVANMKRQAQLAIQHELATVRAELKAEIAEQSARQAEELVRKNLRPADEARMIAAALARVGGIQ